METEQLKQQHLGLELGWTYLTLLRRGEREGYHTRLIFHTNQPLFNCFELKFLCELTHLFMKWSLGPKA